MATQRKEFLKLAGLTGLGVAGAAVLPGNIMGIEFNNQHIQPMTSSSTGNNESDDKDLSIIGLYGPWASTLYQNKIPAFSFRKDGWKNLESWRKAAKERLAERLAIPDIGGMPAVTLQKQYTYDGLHVEELSWQLPYGRATEAILLKPINATGKLPGVLAFHDHGGNKYFGHRKIARTADEEHPVMNDHREEYYSGLAWANEIAKRGYVVLVADAFSFASRRVKYEDVPSHMREGNNDENPEDAAKIKIYNNWAGEHEHVMAKSLFCAGTTWPGVFFAEDRKALDILSARKDVEVDRIGCGGLSGGGLRTVFMAGLDPRIKCAVNVGFMTTWKDFLLYKSFTHTWMTFAPLVPQDLDFPEILGLRAPLPTLVLNASEDGLYTLEGMKGAGKILAEIYKKAGAEDNFKCSFYPGIHKFDKPMQSEAFDWFDRWLKK